MNVRGHVVLVAYTYVVSLVLYSLEKIDFDLMFNRVDISCKIDLKIGYSIF